MDRDREVDGLAQRFYYLGGRWTIEAEELYDGELIFIPSNASLISAQNFRGDDDLGVVLEDGEYFPFPGTLDKERIDAWAVNQEPNFQEERYAQADNYTVKESVAAAYGMLKLNFGDKLMIIPGVRYEYSDNEYFGFRSQADGTYGQNGIIEDTTTYQSYGELFPHLHLKYKPLSWFDVRASYAKTIARPNYNYLIPRAEINNSQNVIQAGNPNLSHSITTGYDLSFSFFDQRWGLFTIGGFYKDIDNIFIPRTQQIIDAETAEEVGWPGYAGYRLASYTNLPDSKVYGYELELQSNLGWVNNFLRGIVFSVNYARLYSETDVYFLTSETTFSGGFPPIPTTTYFDNQRTVTMPTQAPHIFRASLGYDIKGFSVRVSSSFQGTKARSYSLNKDFDSYDLQFWRFDASAKQKIGERWSVFLNLNNISNQQDIRFTRNENYISNIQTYGFTGTIGVQFRYARTKQ
jgi:TonB-dependent receptor